MKAADMNKSTNDNNSVDKERRYIIVFCIIIAVYLAICGVIYALTDINERNAYVKAEPLGSGNDTVPEEAKININTASLDELKTLSGIGDVTAERIIEYREHYGGFLDTEELMKISGIGEKLYKKLRPYITI